MGIVSEDDQEKTITLADLYESENRIRTEFSEIIQAANQEIDSINKRLENLEERFSGMTFGYGEHLVAIDALINTLIMPSSVAINEKFKECVNEGRKNLLEILKSDPTVDTQTDDTTTDEES